MDSEVKKVGTNFIKEKYKIVLMFDNGREIESILLDKRPTEDEIKQGAKLYKADSYRVETVTV